MKRGTLSWYRYRMISGVIFSILGVVIATELVLRPGAPQSKIAGFAFALVAMALGVVRIVQFAKARTAAGVGERASGAGERTISLSERK
jgi:hypothetical protein